jgi:hypothetical protein
MLALVACIASSAAAAEATFPRAADVGSIDGLMKAYYDVISGPANTLRDVARDKSLHHQEARVYSPKRDADDSFNVTAMSIEEYHRQSANAYNDGAKRAAAAKQPTIDGCSANPENSLLQTWQASVKVELYIKPERQDD